ncbi:MAG: undecaprenyl-phosphate galactose phosphotransferase WbaP [Acetobacterales bacterium]
MDEGAVSDERAGPGARIAEARPSVRRLTTSKLILAAVDAATLLLAFLLFRHGTVDSQIVIYRFTEQGTTAQQTGVDWFFILLFFLLFYFHASGHYARRRVFWEDVRACVGALGIAAALDILFMSAVSHPTPAWISALTWLGIAVLLPLMRYVAKRLLLKARLWQIPTVIVGTGRSAQDTCRALNNEVTLGYDVKAFIALQDARPDLPPGIAILGRTFPVLRMGPEPGAFLSELGNPHVVLALEEDEMRAAPRIIDSVGFIPHAVDIVPPLRGLPLYGLDTQFLFAQDILLMRVRNNLARTVTRMIKRAFDLVAASLLIVLLLPLLLAIAVTVGRTGPILYSHGRIGEKGRPFNCLKFRTMVPDAEGALRRHLEENPQARAEWERDYKLRDDPRITRFGAWLRRSSLDELPQLLNVLRGDMSLVGPRPIVEDECARYGQYIAYYRQVKPGITGLWQISGRNDVGYTERVFLDVWYVKNWSLWYDFVILLNTAVVVMRRQGAY